MCFGGHCRHFPSNDIHKQCVINNAYALSYSIAMILLLPFTLARFDRHEISILCRNRFRSVVNTDRNSYKRQRLRGIGTCAILKMMGELGEPAFWNVALNA
jgi:hypothetical protein